MSKKIKKNEGPSCACGRVDIYKETLKNNKTKQDRGIDSKASDQVGDDKSSSKETRSGDQIPQ